MSPHSREAIDGATTGCDTRSDFTALLANCALSISQGGYNTVTELLATAAGLDAGGADESTRILAESAFAGEQVSA